MRLRYITLFIVSMLLFSCHKDEENNNLAGTAQWEDTAPVSSQKGNTAIQLQGNPGTNGMPTSQKEKNGARSPCQPLLLTKKDL